MLGYSPVPKTTPHPVDLEQVRRLAAEGGGALPQRLNVMIVADGVSTSTLAVAGSGFQDLRMAIPVFQIVSPDGSIIVDAADTHAQHEQFFPGTPYYPEKYDRLQAALRKSRLILATHEHFDHIGGLAASPYLAEIQSKICLTPAQIANAAQAGFTPEMLAPLTPLSYTGYTQAAPGVVLIAMPGHTPGSQMVYIRLQSGAEYLLVGDVAWSALSLTRQSGRARLASISAGEDPQVHGQQIRALIDLAAGSPVHLVVSHDGGQIEQYIQDGLLGRDFE